MAERIEARREALGLSKAELIRRIGLDRSATYHDWVAEKYRPTADHLRRLSTVLQMTLEELLGVAGGQKPPFAAWDAFLETPEGKGATPEELATLGAVFWPPGREPTVFSYQLALAAVRAVTSRQG